MTLQKYNFRSGVNRENTRYTNEGGWWDMDKMRFRNGTPEKIGGWTQATYNPFLGVCRALMNWVDLDNDNIMAIGTNEKLYAERGEGVFDITPIVATETVADPIVTSIGSNQVRINFTAHHTVVGSYAIISGATTTNGIPDTELNGEHEITTVDNANYFYITVTTNATSTGSGGGAAVTVDLLLPKGAEFASTGNGWGAGRWSRSTWGSGVSTAATASDQIRLWSFDNYGEDLLANARGNQIFYWKPSLGYTSANRAIPLSQLSGASDTPLYCNWVLSSDQRHVIAFGVNPVGQTTQDTLLIRWSDQENPAMWTPTVENSSGDIRVPMGSYIVTARQTRQEILVWTDTSLHSLQYVGNPYVFGLQTLGDNVSIMGPNAAITVNNVTYWMGQDKFYAYSGRVETLPCSIRRYVFSDINFSQSAQVYAGLNEQFGEIMWFYCSKNSFYVDRYVIYNYLENIWYFGTMARTAWVDSSVRHNPIAASYDGYLFEHESGTDDGSTNPPSPITAYIESADFDIDDGDKFTFIKRIIPDIDFQNSETNTPKVIYTLLTRNFPGSNFQTDDTRAVQRTVSMAVDEYTHQLWVRARGRQAAIRVESTELGVMWQLGSTRFDIRPDGRR